MIEQIKTSKDLADEEKAAVFKKLAMKLPDPTPPDKPLIPGRADLTCRRSNSVTAADTTLAER